MTERAIALAQGMSRKSVLAVFDAADKAGIGSDGHVGRNGAEVYALLFPAGANTRRVNAPSYLNLGLVSACEIRVVLQLCPAP